MRSGRGGLRTRVGASQNRRRGREGGREARGRTGGKGSDRTHRVKCVASIDMGVARKRLARLGLVQTHHRQRTQSEFEGRRLRLRLVRPERLRYLSRMTGGLESSVQSGQRELEHLAHRVAGGEGNKEGQFGTKTSGGNREQRERSTYPTILTCSLWYHWRTASDLR